MLLAPPLFCRNFGVFPLHQIAHVGVSQRISLKLFEVIFEEFQIQPLKLNDDDDDNVNAAPVGLPEVHHRQTNRQTDRRYTESIPRCA